ncbi:DUF305 domain-containing protein [Brevundimonas sp.]|uniref:DUF305 domain-containing protein n=1 Tax=Brevundimonas sp. TaxID=1871086 RepID=UPI002D279D70|nr:DUF305 domain-containing protein [Brevundimonas sp.]HYC66966.1 DUF305 domain-containing protein [Brevundimonas sp.]
MRLTAVVLCALALGLPACKGGGDPVEQALRDASAERQAALVKDGAVSGPAAPDARPASEQADAAFVAGMIEQHRAAMALAVDTLARSQNPEIRHLAQAEIDVRSKQVAELQAWTAPD